MKITDEMVDSYKAAFSQHLADVLSGRVPFEGKDMSREASRRGIEAALAAAPASAAEPVNSGLQNVNPARFEEALSRLYNSSEYRTTVTLRPTLADTLIAALFEQAEIIDRFKRTSAARELAFQAAVGGGDLTIDT